MIKIEITDIKNGAKINGVDVILAEELFDDGKYTGPKSTISNSGIALFYQDRPEEDYDRTVTFIVHDQRFIRPLKGKKPIVQIGIKLNRK